METYQEEQSNNKIVSFLIDVILVLFIFSSPIMNSVLFMTGRTSESGQLAVVYIIVAAMTEIMTVFTAKRLAPMRITVTFLLLGVILAGFFITKGRWGTVNNSTFDSELRLYIATAPTVLLISLILSWQKKTDINIKLLLAIDIFITIICAVVEVTNRSFTSAGYILNSSGFLYQNLSYYCAYCLGITIFIMGEQKRRSAIQINKWFFVVLFSLQLLMCFIAGGRGGIVLSFVLIGYFIIDNGGIKALFKYVIPLIVIFLFIIYVAPSILTSFGVDIQGMTRTLNFFRNEFSDTGRSSLWHNSLQAYGDHIVFGNGIGSVFYLFNSYSHNMFVDVLCETGTVGGIVFLVVLCIYFQQAHRVVKFSQLYRFFTIVFICGFTLNLFSGYIWVNNFVLLPISATLTNSRQIVEES